MHGVDATKSETSSQEKEGVFLSTLYRQLSRVSYFDSRRGRRLHVSRILSKLMGLKPDALALTHLDTAASSFKIVQSVPTGAPKNLNTTPLSLFRSSGVY